MIEEVDDDFEPDNDTSYGKSSNGHEVMIIYEREIFHIKKCGKRKLNNSFSISRNCKKILIIVMISALNNNLPQLQINLCYFHVGQAIQRWLSTHGLQILYNKEDSLLKKFAGLVRALGLLSIVDVLDGYNETIESEHNPLLVIIIKLTISIH